MGDYSEDSGLHSVRHNPSGLKSSNDRISINPQSLVVSWQYARLLLHFRKHLRRKEVIMVSDFNKFIIIELFKLKGTLKMI